MPTIVAMTVVRLDAMFVAVFVTTFCTPPMSFEMRDCTSPVRVRVKNASESRCRWRKTAARRSCMTRWPTWFESSVWIDGQDAGDDRDRDHRARVPGDRHACRACSIASSTRRSRNAGTTPSAGGHDDQAEQTREPPPVRPEQAGRSGAGSPGGRRGRPAARRGASDEWKNIPIARRVRPRCMIEACASPSASSPGCASAPGSGASSSTTSRASTTSGRALGLGDEPPGLLYAVNREYAERDHELADGDEVALIPPVSGGSFRLGDGPLDVAAVLREVEEPTSRRGRELRRHRPPPLARARRRPPRVRGVRGDGRAAARRASARSSPSGTGCARSRSTTGSAESRSASRAS